MYFTGTTVIYILRSCFYAAGPSLRVDDNGFTFKTVECLSTFDFENFDLS